MPNPPPAYSAAPAALAYGPKLPYPTRRALAQQYNARHGAGHAARHMARLAIAGDPRLTMLRPSLPPRPSPALGLRQRACLRRVHEALVQDLVALVPRQDTVRVVATPTGAARYVQSFGHVESCPWDPHAFQVRPSTTLSSAAIKRDSRAVNAYMRAYNANLGCVRRDRDLLLVRSARADTPARLQELLLYGAAHAGAHQLQGAGAGMPCYAPVIISAMDLSPYKAFAARLRRACLLPSEVETRYLRQQRDAVDLLFAQQACIIRRIDQQTIRIKRPLILNLPFSAQANWPSNIKLARYHNMEAAQRLLQQLCKSWAEPSQSASRRNLLATCPSPHHATTRLAWLAQLKEQDVKPLPAPDRLALSFLKLALTQTDFRGKRHLDPTSPGQELLLLRHVLQALHMVPHLQCKSGKDRTLTMLAIVVAADRFEQAYAHPYDPWATPAHAAEVATLKQFFTRAANAFGASCVQLAQRPSPQNGPKWRLDHHLAHPWPQAYFVRNAPVATAYPHVPAHLSMHARRKL